LATDGIVRVDSAMPKDAREWERFLRKLNESIRYSGGRAVMNALTTIATRTGTDIDTLLSYLTDDGKAEDQRFLPQVSAGNVLSLQNVNPLVASADATNATISIAAHTLQYGFGVVSYNAGTIVGLAPSTNYFVYADDPNYAGGAVTYLATTSRQNVTANNGRYFIGAILTAISANTAAITAATSANPIAFTTGTNHGWATGNQVTLTSLPGDFGTNLNNNSYTITVTGLNTFTIAVDGSLYVAYTTGGLASRISSSTSGGAGGGGGWVDDPYYA
jgi:hypothetical protein